ncbi:amino acid-binding protein [Desulfovibrio sp. OttesenSCG-928-C06]|nr:amino acid-binding protein [Desulfovibrio sp. OttesenSCG-928-C06]
MSSIKQLSIFIENKTGRLAQVTDILAMAQINMQALSLADTADFGVLRMIVDDNDKARKALQDAGFTANTTSVIAVEVPHRPGGLNDILQMFQANELNVEYMYAFVHSRKNTAMMIIRCKDVERAVEKLTANGFVVVSEQGLQ